MLFLYAEVTDRLARADWLLTTLARVIFAATLALYFWVSGLTKLGDGLFGFLLPSVGAYAQIFPKVMEAVTYDVTQLTIWHWLVVVAGTWAEFILPALIILGLFTRLASIGMIGFIIVQSLTDIYAHGAGEDAQTLGAWFDRFPDSVILDQRAFWVFLLLVLVIKGAGPLSLDRAIGRLAPDYDTSKA
ncbi:MAG: DoxX family protein [Pseudomonadota bacterium]